MKDAIGGAMSLQMILIFLILINSYLAFSVNYTKAFRVKNEIRSIIEKHEGLTCEAANDIADLFVRANYEMNDRFKAWCSKKSADGWIAFETETSGFCYKITPIDKYGTMDNDTEFKGAYYTIATYVNVLDLPIINQMLGFLNDLFIVKGETALIYSSGVDYDGLTVKCANNPSE